MRIVEAVTRAIEEGSDEFWAIYVEKSGGHTLHVDTRGPDGWDHKITQRLGRGGESNRAGMTHVDRPDGSVRPWLLIREERRSEWSRAWVGGHRITDPQKEPVNV